MFVRSPFARRLQMSTDLACLPSEAGQTCVHLRRRIKGGPDHHRPGRRLSAPRLPPNVQPAENRFIPPFMARMANDRQPSSPADHHEQPAPRMVVFLVSAEKLG